VDILNTRVERVGQFDGVLLSASSDNPLFLVLQLDTTERRVMPIASAWFDQTAEVIRVDGEELDEAATFELAEFERMTPAEVTEFERRVLASCCPEVLRHAGPPSYDTASRFKCPDWLRAK
jgi:hypothetical protein